MDELQDELLLPFRAGPEVAVAGLAGGAVAIGRVAVAIAIAGLAVGGGVHAVAAGVRDEPDFPDLAIHGLLQQPVEPAAFFCDLREVGQLRADGDTVLVRGVVGQAQFLRVIGFEDDGHVDGFLSGFWLLVMYAKPPGRLIRPGGFVVVGVRRELPRRWIRFLRDS